MIYYIDLFSCAGGTTTAISQVDGAEVIVAVNHDDLAIQSHKANHPDVLHFVEDVRDLKVIEAIKNIVTDMRQQHPEALFFIWASLECTNFSKAKGGLPRDADSRTLAECLFLYEEAIKPDGICIENVEEFMAWGPLDENGKPISRRAGSDYLNWVNRMQQRGFRFSWKILNSADYGGLTIRKRYFAQFMRPGLEISWPEPTHSKKPVNDAFGVLKKWRAVKEVLDFSNKGESIFKPGRIRSDKTFERIYAGLVKFVAGGDDSFLKLYYSGRPEGKVASTDGPSPTVTTFGGGAVVQPAFIGQYNGGPGDNRLVDIDNPCTTISTNGRHAVIQPAFIYDYHGKYSHNDGSAPLGTVLTKDHHGFVQLAFIDRQYTGTDNIGSIDDPANTVTTNPHGALIRVEPFVMNNFSGGGQHNSVDAPGNSVTTVPKGNLVTPVPWVMGTNFDNVGSSVDEPARTILSCRKHHYLMNPQYGSKGGSVDDPCFTLIARMDKIPPHLVTVEEGLVAIVIEESDSETVRKIKLFMAAYGIVDIYMRMLTVEELLQIQGLPKDYILVGTQADKKKFIGNSVERHVGSAVIQAQVDAVRRIKGIKAMVG